MKEIVVIPACYRPELLALCLSALSSASDCPEVHIYADTNADTSELAYVRDKYFPTAALFHAKPHISTPSGCWNILNAIKNGAMWSESVYLVEEDIRIYPRTFFKWHQAQTTDVSCGRKDPRFYPRHPGAYTNPGSYLRRPALDKLLPHINDDYFTRLREYLDEHFEPHDDWSHLDDGLIRRVVGACAFPDQPICAHQGYRCNKNLDFIQELGRAETIEEKIKLHLEIEKRFVDSEDSRYRRYLGDFDPFIPS